MGYPANDELIENLVNNFSKIIPLYKEKERRILIGTLAISLGRGGQTIVANSKIASIVTVSRSVQEVREILNGNQTVHPDDLVSVDEDSQCKNENNSDHEEPTSSADTIKGELPSEESCADEEEIPLELSVEEIVDVCDGKGFPKQIFVRQRKEGGGRKSKASQYPGIVPALREILETHCYGNPSTTLMYTNLSDRKIASMLQEQNLPVSKNIVNRLLKEQGWSKQQNRKLKQVGKPHPDRDAQFNHIIETSTAVANDGNPVISIDCKKKENLGDFVNNGSEYRHKNDPRPVSDHDFLNTELGQVAPYGVYVVNNNTGFVNLGTSHDTCEFAVASVRAWWYTVGKNTFPDASMIYITCDGGGSNSSRVRKYKTELASLVEEIGIPIQVSHFPPGTSKWNKVEHRLFAMISKSWAGKPLISMETVVKLIGSTTTTSGLKVICKPDYNEYETGHNATKEDLDTVDIEWIQVGNTDNKWNYIIKGFEKSL